MAHPHNDNAGRDAGETQRLDKWLWFSRVLKSRTLAAQLISNGKVRLNRARVIKPSHSVRVGDVLTIVVRGRVQILRVLAAGQRRGPVVEARQLYAMVEDSESAPAVQAATTARREPGTGRPSKRDRRLIDRLTVQK